MELIVGIHGNMRCVYSETIDLRQIGQLTITRASHVEPTPAGHWTANLEPIGGPVLGPFSHRTEALAAESQWLSDNWLPGTIQHGPPNFT
jgi:hypothetical protein